MKAYKAFNKDMTCRGFQFEEGKTYKEDVAELCVSGFHACLNPLDCWNYYDLMNSEIHEVELDDVSDERNKEDTKICAKKVQIGARLSLFDIVKASITYIKESISNISINDNNSSDHLAKLASSGYCAQLASSGYCAQLASSGYYAQLASSGDSTTITSTGNNSVIVCSGYNNKVRAKKGSWITLTEWKQNNDGNWIPVCVKTEQVDGGIIKEDVFYKIKNGEFVEVEED